MKLTNPQVALLAAVIAKKPGDYVSTISITSNANDFLSWLNKQEVSNDESY